MSSECAMMGVISTKTDVYSFGILLLEILSGKKNNNYYPFNLVAYVSYINRAINEGYRCKYVIGLITDKVCLC